VFLGVAGRFEEALAENRRAQDLDPLSHIIVTIEGWIRAFEGRDDLAIERLGYVLKLVPSYVPALLFLGLSLARSGRGEEGVAALEQAVETSDRLPRALAYLCHACGRAGRRDQATALVAELEERSRAEYVPPYFLAIANAAVGEMDHAFEWLERGYAGRDVMIRDLGVDIACEPLRRDPRGLDVLRRMGLAR